MFIFHMVMTVTKIWKHQTKLYKGNLKQNVRMRNKLIVMRDY